MLSLIINTLMLRINRVAVGAKWRIRGLIYIKNQGVITIGEKLLVNSYWKANPIGVGERTVIIVKPKAILNIGKNVGISNSAIICHHQITIEDDVMIGGSCCIYDTDFHSIDFEDRVYFGSVDVKKAPVMIGKGVWLGARVMVLKGVQIGARSVIAAGSVVTKSIPEGEVWGGNPACFIKKI